MSERANKKGASYLRWRVNVREAVHSARVSVTMNITYYVSTHIVSSIIFKEYRIKIH